jgi:hemerythrin
MNSIEGRYQMAQLLAWKPEYSVGVSELDQQHKGLVAMMNELHDAMMQGKGSEVLGGILKRLIE